MYNFTGHVSLELAYAATVVYSDISFTQFQPDWHLCRNFPQGLVFGQAITCHQSLQLFCRVVTVHNYVRVAEVFKDPCLEKKRRVKDDKRPLFYDLESEEFLDDLAENSWM